MRDRATGLTDTQAVELIRANGNGTLFVTADEMGVDRRSAYNVALGRGRAYEQWQRCWLKASMLNQTA